MLGPILAHGGAAMAGQTVVGVDFSGAGNDATPGNTWVTKGRFDGQILTIDNCRNISRVELKTLLKDLPDDSVAAMDFPFGIPREFIQYLGIDATTMPDVWTGVTDNDKDVDWFKSTCDDAIKTLGGQPKRTGDKDYPESISPLNLRMSPMTFHGMSMLGKLWNETNCQIPPLQEKDRNGIVLLEVMPGAALKAFNLPHTDYKNNKGSKALQNLANRQEILAKLSDRFNVPLSNFTGFRDLYIFSDDALDSLVAAVTAAKWTRGDEFVHPKEGQIADAKLEGRIYVPKK